MKERITFTLDSFAVKEGKRLSEKYKFKSFSAFVNFLLLNVGLADIEKLARSNDPTVQRLVCDKLMDIIREQARK